MSKPAVFTLINQHNGNLAFKIFDFSDNSHFDHLQRNNFYTIIWVKKGNGLLKVDFSEYLFEENSLFTFSPYQPFMFSTDRILKGVAVQFHAEFFCIHRNQKETNCDAVLFNNIYEVPFFKIDSDTQIKFESITDRLKEELNNSEKNDHELIVPNLKILLVTASRIKSLSKEEPKFTNSEVPYRLRILKNAIEENFKEKHSASDYASLLNISLNALAKLVKSHFNKTLTALITERIIIEAKRELYLTSKPVKEIAWNLGFQDEFYFSRLFKTNTDISPQAFREKVGFGKAELN